MHVTGIISEYNPFHNGHKYLIDKHRTQYPDSYFIAVMSGNFTQRGEAAILNKWQRAELAISNGIDLVLELPFIFAVNSAQYFAQGAVSLLKNISCIDTLCFGSEYTDIAKLQQTAKLTLNENFSLSLKKYLQEGISYAAATAKSLSDISNIDEAIFKAPNTILGLEYLKACQKYSANFHVNIIKRIKAAHNDQNISLQEKFQENFASGTAIRKLLYTNNSNFYQLKQVVPKKTFLMLKNAIEKNELPQEENLFLPLIGKLRLAKLKNLNSIYNIREGLEYKFITAASLATNRESFLQKLKSKRYPLTNLQRTLLYLLLDLNKTELEILISQGALYARVLAFNKKGTDLLKQMKKTSYIPIITKTTTYLDSKKRCQYYHSLTALEKMLAIDTYATELYNLCFNPLGNFGTDFTTSPKYLQ